MVDISEYLKKYKSGWIALSPDNEKFVAHARTLKDVMKTSIKRGVHNPSVFKTAPFENYFIG